VTNGADQHAARVTSEAEYRVAELAAVHNRLKASLAGCRELLATANAALDPVDDADPGTVPIQRRKPALTEATPTA
jgi:hypothetical protein